MKIWRYNACFCCLNCLPGGRQFPPWSRDIQIYAKHRTLPRHQLPPAAWTRIRGQPESLFIIQGWIYIKSEFILTYINHALFWVLHCIYCTSQCVKSTLSLDILVMKHPYRNESVGVGWVMWNGDRICAPTQWSNSMTSIDVKTWALKADWASPIMFKRLKMNIYC